MIDGLPAHVLLVHFIVVGLPLAAGMLVLSALWPAARRKFGFLTPLVAVLVLIVVPITTSAGEWLITHDFGADPPPNALHHEHLGQWVWPWAAGIFVMAVVVWVLGRMRDAAAARTADVPASTPAGVAPAGGGTALATRPRPAVRALVVPLWATVAIAVLSVAVAVGGVYWVFLTGEAGAHLVYGGH